MGQQVAQLHDGYDDDDDDDDLPLLWHGLPEFNSRVYCCSQKHDARPAITIVQCTVAYKNIRMMCRTFKAIYQNN